VEVVQRRARVHTPDSAELLWILFETTTKYGLTELSEVEFDGVADEYFPGQQVFETEWPVNLVESLAIDLHAFTEGPDYPDVVEAALLMLRLAVLRFDDFLGDALPAFLVEMMVALSDANGCDLDLLESEAFETFEFLCHWFDPNEPTEVEAVRVWLRDRIKVPTSDATAWSAEVASEQLQLSVAIEAEVDESFFRMLTPAASTPRAMVVAAMTGLSDEQRQLMSKAAHEVAAALRDLGLYVYEPTAIDHSRRPATVVEQIDFDRLVRADLLAVIAHPGATGVGVLIGRALTSNPVRLMFTDPATEVTPLVDHVRELGGYVGNAAQGDLRSLVQEFWSVASDEVRKSTERRLARVERCLDLHEAFVRALRIACEDTSWCPPDGVSFWRLEQLERSVDHFSLMTIEEARSLAGSLDLPSNWTSGLVIDLRGKGPASRGGSSAGPSSSILIASLITGREEQALTTVQAGRPQAETLAMYRIALERRMVDQRKLVGARDSLRLDVAGWRHIRGLVKPRND
jgi:hypothetical protein